jgi:hypothetical protein
VSQHSREPSDSLAAALALDVPGSTTPHVLVLMPSFSIGETTFLHYAEQMPYLEHRYFTALPLLERIPGARMIYLCTAAPSQDAIDYHLSLIPPGRRADARSRLTVLPVDDASARPLALKLLDRPDLLEHVHQLIAGDPGWIEPWNVTEAETAVAERLGLPLHGTSPHLWPLGFKSAGRELFRAAGVPVPPGREDLFSVDEVVAAIEELRAEVPNLAGVVLKHDNAGSGDGNAVLRLGDDTTDVRAQVEALPEWYLADLPLGTVVEELVTGEEFTSPSAQIDIAPDRSVHVRSTHEQLLGGSGGQTFLGCEFPARPEYAAQLAEHARATGKALAQAGVVGRVAVDFAATRDRAGRWRTFALEINLRKGGTTHPYAALRNLVPGHYDAAEGRWTAADGSFRTYLATDGVVEPGCIGMSARMLVEHLECRHLGFDSRTGTGVVLHMLSGFPVTGRVGVIAVARATAEARALQDDVRRALKELADSR